MITLDVNLEYLTDNYNIGTQQLAMYRGKSLQEIMKIEAEKGNKKASKFDINVYSDPVELVRIFQLMDAENRYEIIKNLNYNDKVKLMSMLEKGEMLLGLKFFQKDKLLDMLKNLDKEKLMKVVLEKYSLEEFMLMIPEEEQDKFFDSKKISPEQILKGVQYLEPEQMAKMIENVTGVPQQGKNKKEMMQTLRTMNPEMLKNSVKSLEQEEKAFIMLNMVKEEPQIIREITTESFMAPLKQLQKNDLIEAMGVLKEEDIMDMLTELPEDLMAITATQLDPNKFAQLLATDFSDIISKICASV